MIVFVLKAQYDFIHHALCELVVCGETEVTASNLKSFTDTLNNILGSIGASMAKKHIQVCFYKVLSLAYEYDFPQILNELDGQRKQSYKGASDVHNVKKNRYPNILPSKYTLPNGVITALYGMYLMFSL